MGGGGNSGGGYVGNSSGDSDGGEVDNINKTEIEEKRGVGPVVAKVEGLWGSKSVAEGGKQKMISTSKLNREK